MLALQKEFEMLTQKNKQIMEFFVGIDFGHGDTTAWVISIDDQTEGKFLIIKPVTNDNEAEASKRPTIVYKNTDGVYSLVGDDDCLLKPYIKGRYTIDDIETNEKAKDFSNYIRLVVQELLKRNEQLQDDEYNFKLFIASPLAWNEEDRRNYKEFVNHSLQDIGHKVEWVIGESDAAFFTHYNNSSEKPCVLVIDFGSSTIDYTLMVEGKKASDDTWSNMQLGASNIEENMCSHYIHDDEIGPKIQAIKQELLNKGEKKLANNLTNQLKYTCRDGKENSFTSGQYESNDGKMFPAVFRNTIVLGGNLKKMMDDYPQKVEEEFQKIKNRVYDKLKEEEDKYKKKYKEEKRYNLDLVILSGGAFTMEWLVKMAKGIFINSEVKKDPYPSYVVAKGIALYARKQHQALQDLLKGLDVIPNQDQAIQNFFNGSIIPLSYLADKDVISYEQIFKDADAYASNKMKVSGFRKKMESILDNPKVTRTGEYIRQQVIEYLKTFMISTPEQEKEFEDFFNQQLNNRIVKEFESTILDHFGKKLTDHDKKKIIIHIKMEPFVLKEDNFIEGGTYHIGGGGYMEIDNLLNIALKHASGDICHIDMNKVRTPDHFRNIVNEFIPLYEEHLSQGTYNYNQKDLEKTVSEIKKQVKEQAEKLFYDPDIQLFETTYKA